MNESTKNVRTLIVSFVIAIMFLIPLRFIEVGQNMMEQPAVLGDQTEQTEQVEVVLPNSEVSTIEYACMSKEEAGKVISMLKGIIENGKLTAVEVDNVISDMKVLENYSCK